MAITDKFNNTKTTVNPVVTTVSTARSIGVTSLVCTDLTGWPTTVHFVTYKKTVTGAIDKTTQCEWKGIVSGSTIGTLTLKSGSDAGNAVGDFVEMGPTASWGKDLIDGITTQHNQDGTHAAVTATSLTTTGAVTAGNGLTVSAGTVALPNGSTSSRALTNPSKFSVYLANAQNTTASSDAKILFDTRTFDTGSNVDIVTNKGRFTAPVAGFYQFNASVTVNVNGLSILQTKLYKNGVLYKSGSSVNWSVSGPTGIATNVSDIIQLAANDYVEVFQFCNGVSALVLGSNNTFFSGFLVSTT